MHLSSQRHGKKHPAIADRVQPDAHMVGKKQGGPYIGPRGGKWADPQHTIPWKDEREEQRLLRELNPKPRTGVIEVDNATVRETVDKLIGDLLVNRQNIIPKEQFSWGRFDRADNDGSYREVSAVARDVRSKLPITLKVRMYVGDVQGDRGVSGAHRHSFMVGSGKSLGQEVRLFVQRRPWDKDVLGVELRSVLSHELTHASDTGLALQVQKKARNYKPPTHRMGEDSDKTDDENNKKYYDDFREYLNRPQEVTASLQQMKRELQDPKAFATAKRGHMTPIDWLETHSGRWDDVNSYYSDENKRRVYRTVANLWQAIREGKLEPVAKSQTAIDEVMDCPSCESPMVGKCGCDSKMPAKKKRRLPMIGKADENFDELPQELRALISQLPLEMQATELGGAGQVDPRPTLHAMNYHVPSRYDGTCATCAHSQRNGNVLDCNAINGAPPVAWNGRCDLWGGSAILMRSRAMEDGKLLLVKSDQGAGPEKPYGTQAMPDYQFIYHVLPEKDEQDQQEKEMQHRRRMAGMVGDHGFHGEPPEPTLRGDDVAPVKVPPRQAENLSKPTHLPPLIFKRRKQELADTRVRMEGGSRRVAQREEFETMMAKRSRKKKMKRRLARLAARRSPLGNDPGTDLIG